MAISREDKIARLAILEEKARRAKLSKYVPNTVQSRVHKSESLARFCFSGNGSGKSVLGIHETMWAVQGYNPYTKKTTPVPCKAYIVLDSPSKIESIIIPEMRKFFDIRDNQFHKAGKPYISKITFDNGSWIKFLFWEQSQFAVEGIQAHFVWLDEPCGRPLFMSLYRGGREKGRRGRFLLTGTPLAAPWLRTDIYDPWSKGELPDVECFRGRTEENLHNLDTEWYTSFTKLLSEKEKSIRLEGSFFDLDGLALAHLYRRETHTIDRDKLHWDPNNPCCIAIDPHGSKPHHAVLLGANRDNELFVLEEIAERMTAREFIKEIIARDWFSKYKILDIIYDSAGNADLTAAEGFKSFGAVINEVLSQKNIGRARATSFQEKDDQSFLERIKDALLLPDKPNNYGLITPKLRFVTDCKGIISNIENCQWQSDKKNETNKPKLDISNQDYLSCLKYALATNLYFKKSKDKAYYVTRPMYGLPSKTHGKIIHNASLLRPRGPK